MVRAKKNVIRLATITGTSLTSTPYNNHKKTPVVKMAYMPKDRSLVCLVFMILIACGKKAKVVQVAASNPMMVYAFIVNVSRFQVINPNLRK